MATPTLGSQQKAGSQLCGSSKRGSRAPPNNRKWKRNQSHFTHESIPLSQRGIFPADEFGFFEKKRGLRFTDDNFVLPSPASLFQENTWSLDKLMKLKRRLNATKELLDDLDLSSWHKHTTEMNPAGLISKNIRKNFKPEYCSQAWLKFTECLFSYDVLPKMLKSFYSEGFLSNVNTLHLCEAPGAFISSTNHYLRTKFKNVKWAWTGLTLNPHYEGNSLACMINEDKLILNSIDNWDFFKDNTGNLMSERNITGFLERTKKAQQMYHFVTADGSIDCQMNPGEQETTVAHLHTTEIVTALSCLIIGGSFVLKIFTFLECKTICHLYLLACAFKNVHLFKPGTSKEGNSEVYVVCTEFLGTDSIKDQLLKLLDHIDLEMKDKALFPLSSVDPKFVARILDAATFFTELQMAVILKNINTFKTQTINRVYDAVRKRKCQISKEFLKLYPVERLLGNMSIFGCSRFAMGASLHMDPRSETGTFAEKCDRAALSFHEYLALAKSELEKVFRANVQRTFSKLGIPRDDVVTEWEITMGKSYHNILSSRFCVGKLLTIRQVFREHLTRHWLGTRTSGKPKEKRHYCKILPIPRILGLLRETMSFSIRHSKLEVVCFREVLYSFGHKTDADITRKQLSQLIDKILLLKPGHSIFLCEYPLLTRLHVGLIHVLRLYFTRVNVIYNLNRALVGIFLYGFQDLNAISEGLVDKLCMLKENLERSDAENLILQICQMPKIYGSSISKMYLNYNLVNIYNTLNYYVEKCQQCLALPPPSNQVGQMYASRNTSGSNPQ